MTERETDNIQAGVLLELALDLKARPPGDQRERLRAEPVQASLTVYRLALEEADEEEREALEEMKRGGFLVLGRVALARKPKGTGKDTRKPQYVNRHEHRKYK